MLQKYANPACRAQFRYLHEVRLFEVEFQYSARPAGNGQSKVNGPGNVERWWLGDHCAAHIALRYDPRQGLLMVSTFEDSEKVLTTTVFQSRAAGEVGKVLIRPLDLDRSIRAGRKATSDLNSRRRRVI